MSNQAERIEDRVASFEVEPTSVEPSVQVEEKVRVEELKISGDAVVAKVKELLRQGNIRYLIIKTGSGRTLVEIPLTVGLVGGAVTAIVFPIAAAIAAVGALVASLTIVIARKA